MKKLKHISRRTNRQGFTLVELLIVIVVIAILVTIVTVAYFGITQQARQAGISTAISQTTNLFKMYAAQYGDYPTVGTYTCLAGYDEDGECRFWSGTYYARSSTLESALEKVGTIPSFPDDLHPTYYGLTLRYGPGNTYKSRTARYSLSWKVAGSEQDCGVPNSVRLVSGEWIDAPYHSTGTGYTYCFALLPDPQS